MPKTGDNEKKVALREQEKRDKEEAKVRQSILRASRAAKVRRGIGIGKIIFVVMLVAALMRSLTGSGDEVTLIGLLEYLGSAPQIPIDWWKIPSITWQPPSWFEFPVDFVNFIIMSVNLLHYLVRGAINFIVMTSWGLTYIFGFN